MATIGYWLSSEEHTPLDLVRNARRAEETGFTAAMISDHFHPWTDKQGQAPFAWSVIGAIAGSTGRLSLGTGVTCPTIRYNPVILAQAVATTCMLMPGRFFLGVGTGENLNEHVTGAHWPPHSVRLEMLEEAMEVMRELWQGKLTTHIGRYYRVENARIYSLPDTPPQIMVAAAGKESAEAAGRTGDGYVGTSPDTETLQAFDAAGGKGKPKHGQLSMCWAKTEEEALRVAHEIWPTAGIQGELSQELPLPANFEDAARLVRPEDVARSVVCSPDPEKHLAKIRKYIDAGYDYIYLHQIGPDQEGFFQFYKNELLPRL